MELNSTRMFLRVALGAALGLLTTGCTESPTPNDPSKKTAVCAGSAERCEEAITRAVLAHDDVKDLLFGLAELEAATGKPALADLLAAASKSASDTRAVVVDLTGSSAVTVPDGVARIPATKLGERTPAVWVAIAETVGANIVFVDHGENRFSRVFGRDPIRAFLGGGLPVVTQKLAAPPAIASEIAFDATLREALARAGAFDYVGAAKSIDKLTPVLELDAADITRLRAQAALNAANLSASPLASEDDASDAKTEPPASWPTENLGPYYELLRYGNDKTAGVDHERRLGEVLAAVDTTQRDWLERRYRKKVHGCPPTEPLAFARREDITLVNFLPSLLAREGSRDAMGKLPLAEWDAVYAGLVDLVEREELAYYALPSLLSERGGFAGMNRSGVRAHARVTVLAKKHLAALQALAEAMPGRVGVSQLGFVGSPGAFLDPELGEPLRLLAEKSSTDAVKGASNVQSLLTVVLMGALISMNMPGPIRDGYVGSLASGFIARLRGDLAKEVGFWPASAHALELLYRTAFGLAPDANASSAAITRALDGDPTMPEAGLAAVAGALVRYAALASEDKLGAMYLEPADSTLPARIEARAALAKALTKLHADGPKDPAAANELAALLDNIAATIAYAVRQAVTTPAPAGRCNDEDATPTDPKITRALGKLRDQRKNVLALKSLSESDPWAIRARALAILVSDGLDITSALLTTPPKGAKKDENSFDPGVLAKLHVPEKDARTSVDKALASFDFDPAIVIAAGSFHSLLRGYFASGTAHFRSAGRDDLSLLLGAFGTLMGGPTSNVAGIFLDFAKAMSTGGGGGASLARFTTVAEELYTQGKKSQADMVLLASVAASAVTSEAVPESSVTLARKHGGDAAWLLDFVRYTRTDVGDKVLGPVRFRKELEAIAQDRCVNVSVSTVTGVLDALDQLKAGDRGKGRLALEELLSKPDPMLNVPKVTYVFRHASGKQTSNVQLSLDLAAPFVMGESGFNVGTGFTSVENELFELDVTIESADTKASREGSGRYYVHANALTGLMHFLDGDTKRGEEAAMRAVATVVNRTWFFDPMVSDAPDVFAEDSTATFALLAQAAIESERPLLAGDLLQIAKRTMGMEALPKDIDAVFDPLPKALIDLPGIADLASRAKKTFVHASAGLHCVGPKLDKQAFVAPSCKEFSKAVALRVADATTAHPVLSAKKGGGECEHAALDAFMERAFKGDYADDRFERALKAAQDAGKHYDAWVLLTRLRKPTHCSTAITDGIALALTSVKAPAQRADLMAARLNCHLASSVDVLTRDIEELRDELLKVGDPAREVSSAVVVSSLAIQRKEPKLARIFPTAPRFLERHRRSLAELPAALFIDHATRTLNGETIEADKTEADFKLVCGAAAQNLAQLCGVLDKLRDSERSEDDRKRIATEAVLAATP